MSIRLRTIVVASLVVALGSSVLANRDLVIYLDHGGAWARPRAQGEVLIASVDPTVGWVEAIVANDQKRKLALEALGIVVD